jgi:hypothetical protein
MFVFELRGHKPNNPFPPGATIQGAIRKIEADPLSAIGQIVRDNHLGQVREAEALEGVSTI